jgi:hypothetical protein
MPSTALLLLVVSLAASRVKSLTGNLAIFLVPKTLVSFQEHGNNFDLVMLNLSFHSVLDPIDMET